MEKTNTQKQNLQTDKHVTVHNTDAINPAEYMVCWSSYLNIVCTATMVLQSASVSSSAELDISLFTTTTFSDRVIPARSKSSRLKR
jgi:hypothetical protein